MPGMKQLRARATPSNVLWSSLRTMTRQLPPRSEPGPDVRGFSIVWLTAPRVPGSTKSVHQRGDGGAAPAGEARPDDRPTQQADSWEAILQRLRERAPITRGPF